VEGVENGQVAGSHEVEGSNPSRSAIETKGFNPSLAIQETSKIVQVTPRAKHGSLS